MFELHVVQKEQQGLAGELVGKMVCQQCEAVFIAQKLRHVACQSVLLAAGPALASQRRPHCDRATGLFGDLTSGDRSHRLFAQVGSGTMFHSCPATSLDPLA